MTFTPEEITAMAKEAGARSEHWATRLFPAVQFLFTPDDLSRFAALVAAKEREACCAPDVTNSAGICAADMPHVVVQKYQSAIRARGTKEGV